MLQVEFSEGRVQITTFVLLLGLKAAAMQSLCLKIGEEALDVDRILERVHERNTARASGQRRPRLLLLVLLILVVMHRGYRCRWRLRCREAMLRLSVHHRRVTR